MFDCDPDELSDAGVLTAAAEFVRAEHRAAVGCLQAALVFADRNAVVNRRISDDPLAEPLPGYERTRVYGGEGCPEVAEFAPIEFGAVTGMSSGAAASFIGEALALRHRLPLTWAAVLAGDAIPWRARKIAAACLSLSQAAAAIVDRRVNRIINTLTPGALRKIVKAAVWEADPELAQAQAEATAKQRGVFVAPSDDHGTKRIWVRAAAGAVIRFDATIDDIARALRTLGDPDTLDQRRAKAIDWISDPAAAQQLLDVARYLARHQAQTDRHPGQPAETQPAGPAAADATGQTAARSAARSAGRSAGRASAGATHPDRAPRPDNPMPHPDPAPPWIGPQDWANPPSPPDADGHGGPRRDGGTDLAGKAETHASTKTARETCPATGPSAANAKPADRPNGPSAAAPSHDADSDADSDRDAFSRPALADTLAERLAQIKEHAHSNGLGAGSGRRTRHTLYVHLTDQTLTTGIGVLRVEELGPLLATQLSELLGHDQVIVKPVIDLHDHLSVHAYEIPDRIREHVRLRHPVDTFPYSGTEATPRMDQDHIDPYTRNTPPKQPDQPGQPGQPGQTNTDNLIPLSRLHHRAKTHGDWRNHRLPTGAIEWTSPHDFTFIVDETGTHPQPPPTAEAG